VAALTCTYRKIVGLQYNLYATRTDLLDAYHAVERRYALAGEKGRRSCPPSMREGLAGIICFRDADGAAAIVWADAHGDVLSFVWRDDGKMLALIEAWKAAVGPRA
jgi:hypothetical protein